MGVSHLIRGILLAASLYAILIGSIGLKSLDMHSVVDDGTFFPPALAKIATDEARKGAAVNLAATVQIDRMGHTSSLNTPPAKEAPTQLQEPMIPTQEADTKNRIILPLPFDPEAALRRTERNTTRWINSTNHTIFYNIFISPLIKGGDTFMDEDGRRKAGLSNIRNVIGNQVREIQNSSLRDATVYFNLFGKEYDDPSFWCPPELDCRLMKHQPVGQEVDTLQDLHDFCVDNPSKRVTYLHNKGSLSLSAGNVVVRRLSNRAVFSDACLSMPLSDEYPCNICALKYSFSPHLHAAGNVWMADCSYVRKLVPPVEWEQRRRHMYQLLALPYHKEFACLTNTILAGHFDGGGNFNESAGNSTAQGLGLGRYAFETWILSHPDAIPCQSLHGAITRKAYDKTWRPVLRDAINVVRLQFHGQQKDSWFQKAGRLWEMKYHYGFKPPRSNPFFYANYDRVWSKTGICDAGNVTVASLKQKHADVSNVKPNASSAMIKTSIEERGNRWHNSSEHVIFYNIYVNIAQGFFDDRQTQLVIIEQLNQVRNSTLGDSTVYYNMIGKNLEQTWCPDDMDCRRLNYIPFGGEVQTLQSLFEFCVANPSKRVTYIHDKGSHNFKDDNTRLRRMSTTAATSEACRSIPLSKDYPCNICSMKVNFVPHVHAPGNMWTAQCSYVKSLVAPVRWVAARTALYKHVITTTPDEFPCLTKFLAERIDDQGYFNLTDKEHNKLGLGRYAMETWIFSHPDASACIVLGERRLMSFSGGLEPWDPDLQPVRGNNTEALKFTGFASEPWFHLKGRLLEMNYHYGSQPSDSNSFFWDSYKNVWTGTRGAC